MLFTGIFTTGWPLDVKVTSEICFKLWRAKREIEKLKQVKLIKPMQDPIKLYITKCGETILQTSMKTIGLIPKQL